MKAPKQYTEVNNPLTVKQVKAIMEDGWITVRLSVDLDELISTGGVEGLNDMMEAKVLTSGFMSDLSYRVVGHTEGKNDGGYLAGSVLIELAAEVQGSEYEEEEEDDDDDDDD